MNHFYFAYGSNMNIEQIRRRIPGARPVGRATLRGWRLVERLYADVEPARGGRVEGALYLLTADEVRRLDGYEGFPRVYDRVRVTVHAALADGRAARYRVPAFTYAMTEETRRARDGRPYPDVYRAVCAMGARQWKLPNAFSALQPVETKGRRCGDVK